MHAFFVLDEYTDVMSAVDAMPLCSAAKDAVEHPDKVRPSKENIVGEICRQYVISTV